jgi:hypothetical protein
MAPGCRAAQAMRSVGAGVCRYDDAAANDVAGVETHRELMRHWKSITDVFIQYPELYPQYYVTAVTQASAIDAVRLEMLAEQHTDWLETGLVTGRQLGSYGSEFVGEFEQYAASCLASSAVLRSHVRTHPGDNPPVDTLLAEYDTAHAAGA